VKPLNKKPNGVPKNDPPAVRVLDELPTRKPGGHTHRSFVFYGRSGSGKTTLAATFPKPALLLDCKDVGDDSVADVQGLDVIDVSSWDDFETFYWYLLRHPGKFKTLIIDTASQLQQLAILKIQSNRGGANQVKGRTATSTGDFGTMTRQAWGDVAALMKTWLTNLRDLPMDVVFVAQDRVSNTGEEDSGDDQLAPEVGPALSPSIAKHLNASVHFIANTFIRRRLVIKEVRDGNKLKKKEVPKIEFCLRVGPNELYVTKVRKPKKFIAPALIVDPDYEKLIKIIRGE